MNFFRATKYFICKRIERRIKYMNENRNYHSISSVVTVVLLPTTVNRSRTKQKCIFELTFICISIINLHCFIIRKKLSVVLWCDECLMNFDEYTKVSCMFKIYALPFEWSESQFCADWSTEHIAVHRPHLWSNKNMIFFCVIRISAISMNHLIGARKVLIICIWS